MLLIIFRESNESGRVRKERECVSYEERERNGDKEEKKEEVIGT